MATIQTSRKEYQAFRASYRKPRSDDNATRKLITRANLSPLGGNRRGYMRDYMSWLKPQAWSIVVLLALSVLTMSLHMIEPLVLRYIVDNALLNDSLSATTRLTTLNVLGAGFLAVITLSASVGIVASYRQRLLNERVTLRLRRSLFAKLLRLPLAKIQDMKTGGILARLTGDVDATGGLLQMAIISPAMSTTRILFAVTILFSLNWQLALVALAVIPAALIISLTFARRVRPIYRTVRNDIARIDGHVGEVFSGIRVVRAFRSEPRERRCYATSRNGLVRKQLFAHRRELAVGTSWLFLGSATTVAIIWYGGYLYLDGRATIGDILACG